MPPGVSFVSTDGNSEEGEGDSIAPSATSDKAKALAQLKERRRAEEEAPKLEKEQIENGIKNSTGAGRELWKYRMAVWQERKAAAKKSQAAAR